MSSGPKLDKLDLHQGLMCLYKNYSTRKPKPNEHDLILKQGTKNAKMDFHAHRQKRTLLLISKTMQLSTHW